MTPTLALHLADHRALHHAALRCTFAGAVGALLLWHWPGVLGLAAALTLLGMAAVPPATLASAAMAGALACGAAALFWVSGASELGLVALALCLGASYAREEAPARWPVVVAAGALASALALVVMDGLPHTLLRAPEGVARALAGAGAGLVAGLGVMGRLVRRGPEPAAMSPGEHRATQLDGPRKTEGDAGPGFAGLDGETAELVRRAEATCAQMVRSAQSDDLRAAEAQGQRIRELAGTWLGTERELASIGERELLARRLEQAEDVAAAHADDEEARQVYRQAAEALRRQLAHRDAIVAEQKRLLARLHHQVAVLEQFRLAVLRRELRATHAPDDETLRPEAQAEALLELEGELGVPRG